MSCIESPQRQDKKAKIESLLKSKGDDSELIKKEMLEFIERRRITHYINSIDLGAATYYKCQLNKSQIEGGGGAGVSLPKGIGLEAKIKIMREQGACSESGQDIGIFGSCDHLTVQEEGVIEYEILPIYTLLNRQHEETRKTLQEAIEFYIKSKSKRKLI